MLYARRVTRVGAASLLVSFAWHFVLFPPVATAATVDIPVGTVVTVVFSQEVDPATTAPGQTVMLSVADPVIINGATVIAAGAPVLGEVTVAEKSGAVGKPAKIGVILRHVTAVDGKNVPLAGQKQVEGKNEQATSLIVTILCCILGLLMKGGPATIPAGALVQATTVAPVAIAVPD
jgi:hypothetical protein